MSFPLLCNWLIVILLCCTDCKFDQVIVWDMEEVEDVAEDLEVTAEVSEVAVDLEAEEDTEILAVVEEEDLEVEEDLVEAAEWDVEVDSRYSFIG